MEPLERREAIQPVQQIVLKLGPDFLPLARDIPDAGTAGIVGAAFAQPEEGGFQRLGGGDFEDGGRDRK